METDMMKCLLGALVFNSLIRLSPSDRPEILNTSGTPDDYNTSGRPETFIISGAPRIPNTSEIPEQFYTSSTPGIFSAPEMLSTSDNPEMASTSEMPTTTDGQGVLSTSDNPEVASASEMHTTADGQGVLSTSDNPEMPSTSEMRTTSDRQGVVSTSDNPEVARTSEMRTASDRQGVVSTSDSPEVFTPTGAQGLFSTSVTPGEEGTTPATDIINEISPGRIALVSSYTWTIPVETDNSFNYNGSVYMTEPVYNITILPKEHVRHFLTTKFPANLTRVGIFLKGYASDFKPKSLSVSAVDLHGDFVFSRIILKFVQSTLAVAPPYFPSLAYYVFAPSDIPLDGPLKTVNASTVTDSPLIYQLSNRTVVTVENTTGTLYLASQRVPLGTYYILLYAGLVDHPGVWSYTAIVIYVKESGRTEEGVVSVPMHKMGCPSSTQKFYETTWTPREGNLMPVSVKLMMGLRFETRCGMNNPEKLPSGKYCLYKVQSAQGCPQNFTQDATIVQTAMTGSSNYSVEYCCRDDGNENTPVIFTAWNGPFYLLPFDRICQKVVGFNARVEFTKWLVNYTTVLPRKGNTEVIPTKKEIKMYRCSYTVQNYWPTGIYGLLKPEEGCINEVFSTQTSDSWKYSDYGSFFLVDNGGTSVPKNFNFHMCIRSESQLRQGFPAGNYCVFGVNNTCPLLMTPKTVNITVDSDKVLIFPLLYCCMGDGQIDNEIELPTEHPFYLLLYGWKCQQVKGMDVTKQLLEYRAKYVQSSPNDLLGVTTNLNKTTVTFVVCRYESTIPTFRDPVNSGSDSYMTIILVSTIGVLGLVITIVACICRKRRIGHRAHRVLETDGSKLISISSSLSKSKEKRNLEIGSMLKMVLNAESQMTIYEFLIHPDKLETLEEIGKGAFGTVYRGRYRPDNNPLHAQDVAIKTLKENCAFPEISAFMEEAIVMAGFRHANVLTMIGVCVNPNTHIPTLVLPFMEHGDLQKYLRSFRYEDDLKDKAPELNQLLSFCLHIARGMTYLSDMKFVHRDLAARNCMLDSNMVVKVADFGLTRDVYSNSYYRQDKNKLLPVKWMAIESLRDRVFSIYTDVWSYGVTVWEIFTLGKVPYPELENVQVLPELERGQRLPKPDTCPDAVYDLVLKCWLENPKERPTFVDVVKTIEDVLAGISEYLDLDKAPTRTVAISSGVICSPQDLADLEKKGTPTKMNYVDYREASLKAKGFTESRNL